MRDLLEDIQHVHVRRLQANLSRMLLNCKAGSQRAFPIFSVLAQELLLLNSNVYTKTLQRFLVQQLLQHSRLQLEQHLLLPDLSMQHPALLGLLRLRNLRISSAIASSLGFNVWKL